MIYDRAILFTGAQWHAIPSTVGFRKHWAVLRKSNQLPLLSITIDWSHPLGAITAFNFNVSRETLRCDLIFKRSLARQSRLRSAYGHIEIPYGNHNNYHCQVSQRLYQVPRRNNSLQLFCFTWNIRCDSISMCSVTRRSRLRLLPDALSCLTEIKSATVAKYRNGLISSPRRNNIFFLFCFTWNITVRFNFLVLGGTTIPITIGFRTYWAALRKSYQLLLPSITTNWSGLLGAKTAFDFSVSRETLRCDSISKCSRATQYHKCSAICCKESALEYWDILFYQAFVYVISSARRNDLIRLHRFTWDIIVDFISKFSVRL